MAAVDTGGAGWEVEVVFGMKELPAMDAGAVAGCDAGVVDAPNENPLAGAAAEVEDGGADEVGCEGGKLNPPVVGAADAGVGFWKLNGAAVDVTGGAEDVAVVDVPVPPRLNPANVGFCPSVDAVAEVGLGAGADEPPKEKGELAAPAVVPPGLENRPAPVDAGWGWPNSVDDATEEDCGGADVGADVEVSLVVVEVVGPNLKADCVGAVAVEVSTGLAGGLGCPKLKPPVGADA